MPDDPGMIDTRPPATVYARLLTELHRLINEGKGDGEEAEALADRMDTPWYAMTGQEQARMRGLAADLNAMREGGPRRVDMSPEQLAHWQNGLRESHTRGTAGDLDAALNFLRQPIPSLLPHHFIPTLQAWCWDSLGDLDTALVFAREADRLDSDQAISVMVLLQRLGRFQELPMYANRVIANAASSPLELYLAAVALLSSTYPMSPAESSPIIRQVVSALRRALSAHLDLPPAERPEPLEAGARIAEALGHALERLGDLQSAVDVYSEAIAKHPRDGELFVSRGLALYRVDLPRALDDLKTAAHLGAPAIWPYLLLARHALQSGAPGEALRLARIAENQPGDPSARAEVYELVGMALAESGRPQQEVLASFDRALALDPKNERIRENREIAAGPPPSSQAGRPGRRHLVPAPLLEPMKLQRARGDEIRNRSELYNEQRREHRYEVRVAS